MDEIRSMPEGCEEEEEEVDAAEKEKKKEKKKPRAAERDAGNSPSTVQCPPLLSNSSFCSAPVLPPDSAFFCYS